MSLSYNAAEKILVSGNARMLQRMLANILDNAVKYTPSGGKIDVSVAETKDHNITISIKDTGVGISGADLNRIFERFYRCDQSRSQPGHGTRSQPGKGYCPGSWRGHHRNQRRRSGQHIQYRPAEIRMTATSRQAPADQTEGPMFSASKT